MENELVRDLMKRYSQLKRIRSPYEDVWEECTEYVLPRRSNLSFDSTPYPEIGTKIYNGTPQEALEMQSNGLQGYLVSPSMPWFKLMFTNQEVMRMGVARKWLQEAEAIIYDLFQRSNFYETMSEVFDDGATVGTASIYCEEDDVVPQTINFRAPHFKQIFVDDNRWGRVDTVFNKMPLTGREAIAMFGEEIFDSATRKRFKENPYEIAYFIHAVLPREERETTARDRMNMPFASFYIYEDKQLLVDEGGYLTMPYIVWRWRTNTGETYGSSPTMRALPDIKRLNQISKTILQAGHRYVEPPVAYPAEMIGTLDLRPRGMNPYEDPNRIPFPINTMGSFPIARDIEAAIEEHVRAHFHADFFLLMSQQLGHNMTATQVVEMQGEKAAVLGTITGRINNELLAPTIRRVFSIAQFNNWLPELPQQLQSMQAQLQVEFIGPLVQAQKRFHQTQGINSFLSQVIPLVEVSPPILDNIDMDEMVRHMHHTSGAPQEVIVDQREVEKLRQQRAQQQQQMQQMQLSEAKLRNAAEVFQKTKEKAEAGTIGELVEAQYAGRGGAQPPGGGQQQ